LIWFEQCLNTSVYLQASEEREPEQTTTTDGVEISIQVEYIQNADGHQNDDSTTDASDTNKTPETIIHSDFTSK